MSHKKCIKCFFFLPFNINFFLWWGISVYNIFQTVSGIQFLKWKTICSTSKNQIVSLSWWYTTRWIYKWQTLQACSCSQWHNSTIPQFHPTHLFTEYIHDLVNVFYFWIYLLLQYKFTSDLLIPIYQVIWCMDKFKLFAHVIVVMSSFCVFIIWSIRCTYCFMLHIFAHWYILTCMKNHTRLCFIIKEENVI